MKPNRNNPYKVLIFPAGEVNSSELHDALCNCVNIEVWGASSIERHGKYLFENYIPNLPLISSDEFLEQFNRCLAEHHIDVVFPTHDTVALFLAQNRERINAKVAVADLATSQACRDKKLAYERLADCDFVPRIYTSVSAYPVFIKPRQGQGAVGAKLIRNASDPLPSDLNDYVICEYLPGMECTVDCITDSDGVLKGVFPRQRTRISNGITAHGTTLDVTDEILRIAQTLNDRFGFLGLWWFQLKEDADGKLKLLEISTRCAGTMCLTRARGVNLPLLSVYAAMGLPIHVESNNCTVEVDRILISRYELKYDFETVYVDYDDTVIVRDKVQPTILRLLYQFRAQNKRVVLISRHDSDHPDSLEESMVNHYISPGLFDQIIKIGFDQKKSNFINPEKAIFIDNAFKERHEVLTTHGIPVFDVDTAEALIDWRQ